MENLVGNWLQIQANFQVCLQDI